MMIFLMKPKYYIPVKGEYRLLHMNSEIALEMGYSPSKILILDNGQVATFEMVIEILFDGTRTSRYHD